MIGEDEIISDVSAIKEAASMDFFFFFYVMTFLGERLVLGLSQWCSRRIVYRGVVFSCLMLSPRDQVRQQTIITMGSRS